MKRIRELFYKHKEGILYIVFGIVTTLVNIVAYKTFTQLGLGTISSTSISWFLSVLVAYITNKLFVFQNKNMHIKYVTREILTFYSCRLTSGLVDLIIMSIFVDIFQLNNLLVKCASNVIVIILNYVFSKYLIFTQKKKE